MKLYLKLYLSILTLVSPSIYAVDIYVMSDSLNTDTLIISDSLTVTTKDTVTSTDTTTTPLKKEPLIPVRQITTLRPYEYGSKIKEKNFKTDDYRSSADLFTYLPYGFLQDLGQFGQPNEQIFYGMGFGNIGYNRDGLRLNNLWQNSFDLNRFPFERTDSLEVLPLTRGFLFNLSSNPVSVNFYNRDYFSPRPITRLKFYQGSFDEGFIDLLFHTFVTNRLTFGFGLTVSGIDSRFYNSDYESWKFNGKLSYMFSKNLFVRANYYFTNDSLALNGGLPTSTIENGYYSKVLYTDRYQLSQNHYGDVKVLANIFPNSKTDLTLYYQYDKQTFRQNANDKDAGVPKIINDNSYQTIGMSFRNDYVNDYFNLLASANYELVDYSLEFMNTYKHENTFAVAGQLQLTPLESLIVPTFYAKYTNYASTNFIGFGADVNIVLSNIVTLFGGVSFYSKPHSIMERYYSDPKNIPVGYSLQNSPETSKVKALEVAAKFNLDFFNADLSYFAYNNSNAFKPIIYNYADSLLINEVSILESYSQSISGVNIDFSFKVWKLLFSNNVTYYFPTNKEDYTAKPDFSVAGKLYYIDMLFNNNLRLKTGINYRFTGEQPYFVYDFEKSMQTQFVTSDATGTHLIKDEVVPISFQFDLFLAGTIQEVATVFFVLENVINNEYYIVPYYYKQPQMLRLGVSWILFD